MFRRLSFVLLLSFVAGATAHASDEEQYSRLARISYLDGNVSFQHAGDTDWVAASINMALQPADRVYTGPNGRAEIEFDDGSVLRLAEKTDVELLALRDELMQMRILIGLATLNVQSGVDFEINTPAAAFSTLRKGIYRFDVAENGDSDGIVRKGELEAAADGFKQGADSGELIHATPGEQGTAVVSRYDGRDQWDEWNDRRNAEMTAYASRRYLPDNVQMGVRDLDLNGRWVDVEYGPAWVPSYVGADWSPYWEGRWVYRPFWGWTWVSYEPWGWLPYHYGRWYRSSSFGWCWLPGASFGFNFWSPGLVRFYHGPSWISWCPLGPGDYYNVNNYYYRRNYAYQLSNLRMLYRRSPDDLFNRHVAGAFRTAGTDHFLTGTFGSTGRVAPVPGVDQPWRRGSMVTDRLGLSPVARSYAPAPDRAVIRPSGLEPRPVVVRTEPAVRSGPGNDFLRITNPGGRAAPAPGVTPRVLTVPANPRTDRSPASGGASIWNRRAPDNTDASRPDANAGRVLQSNPQPPATIYGRPGVTRDSGTGRNTTQSSPSVIVRPVGPDRQSPSDRTQRQSERPAPSIQRYERAPAPQRREPEQSRPEQNTRRPQMESSYGYAPRVYGTPEGSFERPSPPVRQESSPAGSSIMRSPERRVWQQQSAPPSAGPSWGGRSAPSAPSMIQRPQSGGPAFRSAPSAPPMRSGPSGGGAGIMRRRDR